jgi:hypothetical protein
VALYDPQEFPETKAASPNELAALKILDAAVLIERGWLQRLYAQDALGRCVNPDEDTAVSFCIIGALSRVNDRPYRDYHEFPGIGAVAAATGNAIPEGISGWNDAPERTQAEVVAALHRAAELARQGQSA